MLNSNYAFQPDDPFLRSCAIDLLHSVREIRQLRKEQLFADAITFYRWYYTTSAEPDLDAYRKIFDRDFPQPAVFGAEADAGLSEALFITWFLEKGYHRQSPLNFVDESREADT